jgi:hypothetical protein
LGRWAGLTDPEWYPHQSVDSYYTNYWDRLPEPGYDYPQRAFASAPSDLNKPVYFNGETYYY